MHRIFSYNNTIDIPIYQQLVDKIRMAIKNGILPAGEKLPTVQELSSQLEIARGTVKRIYDELERENLIEKTQGRGTFVRTQSTPAGNRKELAMEAIDQMLNTLCGMGFSMDEIHIFLNLKLREREEETPRIKAAILECNPENLDHLTEQLQSPDHLDLFPYLVDNILAYPYHLQEDTDLIITTTEHAKDLEVYFPDSSKLVRIALRLSSSTLAGIIKLPAGSRVGILTYSDRFGELLCRACGSRNPGITVSALERMEPGMDINTFLSEVDTVLVPKLYRKYCTGKIADALDQFSKTNTLLQCSYKMDEGSSLYLEERIRNVRNQKTN